jgi:ferredoxin
MLSLCENSILYTEERKVRKGAVIVTVTRTIEETPRVADPAANGSQAGTVTIYLERKKVSVPLVPGETLLESARRAGLDPPFNCEAGNCGTCMARLEEGHVTMRVNDALEDDEVADGYILTCQSVPDTDSITVRYE